MICNIIRSYYRAYIKKNYSKDAVSGRLYRPLDALDIISMLVDAVNFKQREYCC